MIWRDDDILWLHYPLSLLLEIDDLFQAAGVTHTLAILASTLTPDVAAAIRARDMVPQLHGWRHDDLSVDGHAIDELPQAVLKIEELVGIRPTVLYPPWNKTSPVLEQAAAALGLTVSSRKLSLSQVIRNGGVDRKQIGTINFHYWADECALLPQAFALVKREVAA